MARFTRKLLPAMLGLSAAPAMIWGSLPAAAQYYPAPRVYVPAPPPYEAVDPREVDAIVRSLGLRLASHVRVRGPMIVVDARGQEGSLVRVSIDRHSGRVVQIVRVGRDAPRIVAVPAAPGPGYGTYEDDEPADLDGPSVITRRGIESGNLPPPAGAPEITASVPRESYRSPAPGARGTADPLAGVPKEFRGQRARPDTGAQQKTAARPADPAPRAAPSPRPRPDDVPRTARTEDAPAPAAKPAPEQREPSPAAREDIGKFPPVQGFE